MRTRRDRASPRILGGASGQTKERERCRLETKWDANRREILGEVRRGERRLHATPWIDAIARFYVATGHPSARALLAELATSGGRPNLTGPSDRAVYRQLFAYWRATGSRHAQVLLSLFRSTRLHRSKTMTQFAHTMRRLRRERRYLENLADVAIDEELRERRYLEHVTGLQIDEEFPGSAGSVHHACMRVAPRFSFYDAATCSSAVKGLENWYRARKRGTIDERLLGHGRRQMLSVSRSKVPGDEIDVDAIEKAIALVRRALATHRRP